MNKKLYTNIDAMIENYRPDEWDWEQFREKIIRAAKDVLPDDDYGVQVYFDEVGAGTYSPETTADDLLSFVESHHVIAHAVNWDLENENMITTIVYKKKPRSDGGFFAITGNALDDAEQDYQEGKIEIHEIPASAGGKIKERLMCPGYSVEWQALWGGCDNDTISDTIGDALQFCMTHEIKHWTVITKDDLGLTFIVYLAKNKGESDEH